jgi:predicted kinase
MTDLQTAWDKFLADFKQHPLWKQMEATVEDSPWHREANVAVHTQMILDVYHRDVGGMPRERDQLLTKLAILFHDTGKPDAEQEKESAERGKYRVYAGHEKLSARTWVDFALTHREALAPFKLDEEDISTIAFLIEHHLPYSLKDPKKRAALKTALVRRLGSTDIFFDLLRCDARGRISDDHETKLAAVEVWIAEFEKVEVLGPPRVAGALTAYVLSGVSGAGKTTFIKSLPQRPVVFSLDECRLRFWYGAAGIGQHYDTLDKVEAYRQAFAYCVEHEKEFDQYAQRIWREKLQELSVSVSGTLVVDNTHLSRKARARYVHDLLTSPQRPFVVGVSIYAPLGTVLERQASRGDKAVPVATVRDMYFRQEEFMVGSECDDFMVVLGAE